MVSIVAAAATIEIDVARGDQDLTIYGADSKDALTNRVSIAVGDVNNDGRPDLVVGALSADGPGNLRNDSGEVYVFLGPFTNGFSADLMVDAPDIVIFGKGDPTYGDNLGRAIVVADVSGDGIADLLIGAPDGDGPGPRQNGAGRVDVLLGPLTPGTIDLQTRPADVVIYGVDWGEQLGTSIAVADISGDGQNDLVMGAPTASGSASAADGACYALFGPLVSGSTVDLRTTRPDLTILGADFADFFGGLVVLADWTADGNTDIAVAAKDGDGPANARTDAGEVSFFFGPFSPGTTIDLATQTASLTLYGADPSENLGQALAGADLSGDGQPDFALGIWQADGPGNARSNCGEVHAVFGPLAPGALDLAVDASDVTIYGAAPMQLSGYAVAAADVTGDGASDLIVGVPRGQGPSGSRWNSGEADILVGPFARGTIIDLAIDCADVTMFAAESNDYLGYGVLGADLSGDGVADLLAGAPFADGPANDRDNSGELYVAFGGSWASPCLTIPAAVTGLVALRNGTTIDLRWDVSSSCEADHYNVWEVVNGDKSLIPEANLTRSLIDPNVLPTCLRIPHWAASCGRADIGAPPDLLYFQVRAACADDSEGTEHPF